MQAGTRCSTNWIPQSKTNPLAAFDDRSSFQNQLQINHNCINGQTMSKSKTTFTAEPGKPFVVMTREFDAPLQLVHKVMSDPESIPEWWGPAGMITIIDKFDAHNGGEWRILHRDNDGGEFAFRGVFHTVSPEYTARTFEWEGLPGHISLESATLEERNGKTLLTTRSVFQTQEDRDGMVGYGMESGATESMDRLAQLVSKATQEH